MNTQRLTSAYKDLNHGGEDNQRLARSRWQQRRQGQQANHGRANEDKSNTQGRDRGHDQDDDQSL